MIFYVNSGEPLQTVNDSISFYSAEPVTVEYSVDGINYVPVDLSSVTFPDNIVIACKQGTYFRISGFTGKKLVNN